MLALLSAIWLGILTSISPCPLATNIAAITFLSKKIVHPRAVLLSGIAYTLGRMITYAIIGTLIVTSLVKIPVAAMFLQKYMNKILGPLLLIVGLVLVDIIKINLSGFTISHHKQHSIAESGFFGSGLLGIIFSLSFCPISAALFFGSLIPLAVNNRFGLVFPFFYGIGTGLPVILFALGIAMGMTSISHWFNKVKKVEAYTRKITGVIFIIIGAYFIYTHIIMAVIN
ncbi:MAG: aromatic aminobenezylarsenical efflux permease ArsG family transporter [Candidatus Auribacterota bacterium]|jgi:cytochrome c biogenesis protein CcdA|nr:aromatic aminobenezylarsenical efflux permease ArsG family transporter [Candidatus Auribacterota bacterium]